ncbi:MAG TPA: DUF4142 domain-containing protein [Sphingobacteriaceae bacterium]
MKTWQKILFGLVAPMTVISACGITEAGRKGDTSGTNATAGGLPMMLAASSKALVHDDNKYLIKASMAGMKEVRAGEIAQTKADNDSVRSFAARMVKYHVAANRELMSIAALNNLDVPMDETDDREIMDLTNERSGTVFDQKYMKMVSRNYGRLVNLQEKAASEAENSAVRAYFKKHLPVIKLHQQQAEAIESQLN